MTSSILLSPRGALVCALLCAGTTLAADPPAGLEVRLAQLFANQGLTANDTAKQAVASSRDVMAKDAARDGAQASLDAARFAYIPRVTAGVGYVLGRDLERAGWVARIDALLQQPEHHHTLMRDLVGPLRLATQQVRKESAARTAASRVQFYTLKTESMA